MRHEALFSAASVPVPGPVPFEADPDEIWVDEPVRARPQWRTVARLLPRVVLGLAALMLLLAAGLYGVRSTYSGKVYPAVQAGGVPLGGLSHDDARGALQRRADELQAGTLAFTFADKTWRPTLGEIGAAIDVNASLDGAYGVGREDRAADRVRSTFDILRRDEQVPLVMSLDHNLLNAWFDRVDQELGLPPRDAYLAVEGTQITPQPEVEGTVVDRGAARERVLTALRTLQPLTEPLPVVAKIPAVRLGDLGPAQQQLVAALAQPIKVSFEDASWSLAPTDLGRFVTQKIDPTKSGAEALSLGVDQAALAGWLAERFNPEVNRDPRDAAVAWDGERLISMEWSVDGITLKQDEFAAQVGANFFGGHAPIDIPVTVTPPTVQSENLDKLGVTTKLGTGDSNFGGSDGARATNIYVGVDLLNGTLVPPRGEFSFHHAIGVISPELGFVEGQGFEQGLLQAAVGGGICQVSTTMFRAALKSGLPITEYWPHDYRLGFYEADGWGAGYDASILQPDEDPFSGGNFKFYNPTDSWMLVEAFVEGVRVYVNIYGADLGYDVRISESESVRTIPIEPDEEYVNPDLPEGTVDHSELPQEGEELYFVREVFDRDGNPVPDVAYKEFWTTFKARGNVYWVSPDMVGKSPAKGNANVEAAE